MRPNKKNTPFFILALMVIILFFLYPLIFMRKSFLFGDNFIQFYPWFKCYSEAIKNCALPYWVKGMGSGFPLMAEGQVGGFYPLNMVLFFILPLNAAFNYSIIFHFIIAGIFTYLYARKSGADELGGCISSLLFCFGSAYAGCFYNIITLRTLAWFPMVLFLFECYFEKRRYRYIVYSGLALGFQFLAGFIQMAAYSAFFYLAYLIYRSVSDKAGVKYVFKEVFFFLVSALIIAFPQLLLTHQLSTLSGREYATLGFALWRSFAPPGLLGLVFPFSFTFLNVHFYVGVLSLLFVVFSICMSRGTAQTKAMLMILVLSIFFALGWFNPLYVLALKATKFYFFRNPSKFLFFGAFALSVLAGTGFTKFFESNDEAGKRKAVSIFRYLMIAASAAFLIIIGLLSLLRIRMFDIGNYFVKNFIFNKPHHRYSVEYYMDSFNAIYEKALSGFSFSNIFVIFSWAIVIIAIIAAPLLLKRRNKIACSLFILADIYIFGFYGIGFSGNTKPFECLKPDNPGIFERLRADKELFRVLPFDLKSGKLSNWAIPNANLTYGIDSIACYTPLAVKAYKDNLDGLEVVDDSLGLKVPDETAIIGNLETMRLLNVKYLISCKALQNDFLKEVMTENGIYLYELRNYLPRAFFSVDIDDHIKEGPAGIKISNYRDGALDIEAEPDKDGFIIFSENYYPGWHAYIDGKEVPIIKIKGIVQAVALRSGRHKVNFVYKPYTSLFKR